jgi:hypothetical protein
MVSTSSVHTSDRGTQLKTSENVKLVIFVPQTHAAAVRKALAEAGAGKIGGYDHCSFTVIGTAAFRALEGSRLKSDAKDLVEEVIEARIETICCASRVAEIVKAVRLIHPYKRMGYDISPLLEIVET